MKIIGWKRSRVIKVCLAVLIFILIVAFFAPKPKGFESSIGEALANKVHKNIKYTISYMKYTLSQYTILELKNIAFELIAVLCYIIISQC